MGEGLEGGGVEGVEEREGEVCGGVEEEGGEERMEEAQGEEESVFLLGDAEEVDGGEEEELGSCSFSNFRV